MFNYYTVKFESHIVRYFALITPLARENVSTRKALDIQTAFYLSTRSTFLQNKKENFSKKLLSKVFLRREDIILCLKQFWRMQND